MVELVWALTVGSLCLQSIKECYKKVIRLVSRSSQHAVSCIFDTDQAAILRVVYDLLRLDKDQAALLRVMYGLPYLDLTQIKLRVV